jgi:hypothetical protein
MFFYLLSGIMASALDDQLFQLKVLKIYYHKDNQDEQYENF